jgi:molybdopterin-guanine dinucleotide biosynthesis protein A
MSAKTVTGPIVGVVLAGGRSRRMGSDKASLPLLGRPLAAWAVSALQSVLGEVWLIGGSPSLARDIGVCHAPDLVPGAGPLAGIYGALQATRSDIMVVACDMPLLQPSLLRCVLAAANGFDVVVPINGGEYEPLLGVYRQTCLEAIEKALAAGERQVRSIYPAIRLRTVPEPLWRQWDEHGLSFINANSPSDLERVVEAMESQGLWKTQDVCSTAS